MTETWQPLVAVTEKIVQELEQKQRDKDSFVEFLIKCSERERVRKLYHG